MKLLWIALLGSVTATTMAHGQVQASPISSEQVAALFGYSGPLETQDISNSARLRNPGIIWSANYLSAEENSPSSLSH